MPGGRSRRIVVASLGIAVFLLGSSAVDRLWNRFRGSARLVSVEEVPDSAECLRPVSVEASVPFSSTHNLFSDFAEPSVEAQDAGPTVGFDRPPVRILRSFQIYAPKGWIVSAMQGGSIGVWSVNDNGDVPPRWKIPVNQLTGYTASRIDLDPVHKEMLLSCAGQRSRPRDGIANAVLTFSWPEIF